MSHLDSTNLPENIRKCMDSKDRKELKTPTFGEALEKTIRAEELKMHKDFVQWCNYYKIPFVHSRTDKKATTGKGTPDFILLLGGKGCAIEFKGPHGKLTPEQEDTLRKWEAGKVPCLVATSLRDAINFAVVQLEPDFKC